MSGIALSVLSVSTLLATVVATEPLARRLRLPLSITLVLVGIAMGYAVSHVFPEWMDSLSLPGEAFLYLFLPILLFETAIEIDVRRLLEDLWPIMLLAVVAVLASTLVVGITLTSTTSYGLIACLLLAAIVSTTDPVAVVALFKDLNVPHRLTLLVEGESLFNDAAAIALFVVLMSMITTGSGDANLALWTFLRGFSGGILVGFLLAVLAIQLLRHLPDKRMAEMTVTLAVAYLAYVVGEKGLHVSGVVAVVMAALVFAYDGRTRVSPQSWSFLVGIWKQLGYWASSLIFLLAAVRIPGLLADANLTDLYLLGILLLSAMAARALVLFGLMPVMSSMRLAQKVDGGLRLVILWGGLRGAISLALALAVLEHPDVPADVKRLVATLVTAFVLVTLFLNGLTLRPLIKFLGMDRLPPIDRFLRGRAIAHSLGTVQHRLDEAASQYRLDSTAREDITRDYTDRLREAESQLEADTSMTADEKLRAALIAVAQREQSLHFQHYRERIVSGRIVRNLVARAYAMEDAAKADGQRGYVAASQRELAFPFGFRLAVEMQRRFGAQRWLAESLANRLESLLVARASCGSLLKFIETRIPSMLGADTAHTVRAIVEQRLHAIENALSAMRLQYGEFTDRMQTRYLGRAALRIEDTEYRKLHEEAVISKEVFNDLLRDLEARWRRAAKRPELDLNLDPQALLARLPLFGGLGKSALHSIAQLLQPRFVLPDETIIQKGDRGREMFFLVSGAVEIAIPGQPVRLGSGQYFGELALLAQTPRTADVKALGFCQLLVLTFNDFSNLLDHHPELREHITQTARERLARA